MSEWPPQRDEVMRSFDVRASTYDSSDMHRWVARVTAAALMQAKGATVVDAAAGTALAGRWLLDKDPTLRVLAIDIAARLLAAGQERAAGRLWAAQADAALLPLREGCVDGVVCASALAFMPDVSAVFDAFARVLRPRGRIAVQAWAADGLLIPKLFRSAAASVGTQLSDPNASLGHPAYLEDALAGAGFAAVEVVEHTWRQPLPAAEDAWSGIFESTAGVSMRTLPPDRQQLARARFLTDLNDRRVSDQTDPQVFYVATATKS